MRLDVKAATGYTSLKLNDQNLEDDVAIRQKDLNTWKTKTLHGKFPTSHSNVTWSKNHFYGGLIYIYPEMDGFGVAIHDWVTKTRYNEKPCLEVEAING
jgi:hypothetical protein